MIWLFTLDVILKWQVIEDGIRTKMDKKRKNSPLIRVKNSILIRTDRLTKKQVLTMMSRYIEKLN